MVQEKALKDELDLIDDEKRVLEENITLWQTKKRENETIEKVSIALYVNISILKKMSS